MPSRLKTVRLSRLIRPNAMEQRDQEELRNALPVQPSGVLSDSDVLGNFMYEDFTSWGVANRLYLLPLQPILLETRVSYLRTSFGTLDATMCLYYFEDNALKLIRSSIMRVDGPGTLHLLTTPQENKLPAELHIQPGARLFVGCWVHAAGSVLGLEHGASTAGNPKLPIQIRTFDPPSTNLPKVLKGGELSSTRMALEIFPAFAYLSTELKNFM